MLMTPFRAFTGTTVSRVHASVSRIGEREVSRHDTDHRVRLTVETHELTDDVVARSETALPQV